MTDVKKVKSFTANFSEENMLFWKIIELHGSSLQFCRVSVSLSVPSLKYSLVTKIITIENCKKIIVSPKENSRYLCPTHCDCEYKYGHLCTVFALSRLQRLLLLIEGPVCDMLQRKFPNISLISSGS